MNLLDHIFPAKRSKTSRLVVKERLTLVLAHDRADLCPQTLENMRREIVAVVSRYVELDPEGLEFSIESQGKATALVANLPIRQVRGTGLRKNP